MSRSSLADHLLAWYRLHGRKLPWRDQRHPYAVWVSEIMLQQTRVETVIPYFERWMRRFPTLQALAAVSQQEVLQAWEGLGYYGRARSLHKAAQIVVNQYGGQLPRDPSALKKLPGIGPYTAGAIASIAFGLDVPTLDGNLRRVFARLFDVETPVDSPAGERLLLDLAAAHLPDGQAGDYNQALMDLGALICLPKKPLCASCPLQTFCLARARGVQEERPRRKPQPAVPHYTVTAGILRREGRVLLAQRPPKGLLGGLWEFPGGKQEDGESLQSCLQRELQEELGIEVETGVQVGVFRHAYTHFQITLHAFECTLKTGEPHPIQANQIAWVSLADLHAYPMGKVDRLIARRLQEQDGSTGF
ncbi:MAG: A/G-specific adenine glycosylase [Candidatus Villigracilaceae bacterium]